MLAPFISITAGRKVSRSHCADILPENNRLPCALVPQLIGKNPEGFIRLADYLYESGYATVNWNLGCPDRNVVRKMHGSGMLPHADAIRRFLDKVIPSIRGSLSIKTRTGLADPDELVSLMPMLNTYPIKELIIHPRTGKQKYSGAASLSHFKTCLAASTIPVVYNGDICSRNDFLELIKEIPALTDVMISRGLVINPFLAQEIKTNRTGIYSYAVMREFHDEIYDSYGKMSPAGKPALNKMKELWFFFSRMMPDGQPFLQKIRRATTNREYEKLVDELFSTALEKKPGMPCYQPK